VHACVYLCAIVRAALCVCVCVCVGSMQVHRLGSLVEFSESKTMLIPNNYR